VNGREAVPDAVARREPEMFALLAEIIEIQSGSRNKAGVDRMARRIRTAFEGGRVVCEIVPEKDCGNHLVVRSAAWRQGVRQILLTGHMDTVFPHDTDFNRYREDEERAYGPGVIDMKGGLVAGIFALKALDAAGLLDILPITFVFNADEEIGSPRSGALIEREARASAFAFVLEAGGSEGGIVTGRKGNLSVRIDVKGRAGHAAAAPPDKASAILALAHQTIAIEALNAPARGITANVGRITGGIGYNTVPAEASAAVDFRFPNAGDDASLKSALAAIVAEPRVPNTSAECHILSGRPAMPQSDANLRLFDAVREVAGPLNVPVKSEFRYGVSDANIIAAQGTPVLDGLGPAGARDHSEDEYMIKSSLADKTRLLACALCECWHRWTSGRLF